MLEDYKHHLEQGGVVSKSEYSSISPDGKTIMFEFEDTTSKYALAEYVFWDVASRKTIHQRISIKALAAQPVSSCTVAKSCSQIDSYDHSWSAKFTQWSADSKHIILCGNSCGWNPTIGVVDIATGEFRDILRQSIETSSLSFAPSGKFFVAVGSQSALNQEAEVFRPSCAHVFDFNTGKVVYEVAVSQRDTGVDGCVHFCEWSPNGRFVLVGDYGRIQICLTPA